MSGRSQTWAPPNMAGPLLCAAWETLWDNHWNCGEKKRSVIIKACIRALGVSKSQQAPKKPNHHTAPGSYPAEKPIGKQTHCRDHDRIAPRNATS